MPAVPGLRSPYAKVGRLIFFGRMLDKIRLHAAGKLPVADYAANLGKGFDLRCVSFLRVAYDDLKARTLAGGTDEQLLAWAHEKGGARTDEECEIWNGFMMKRGWRDAGADILAKRIRESHLESKTVLTMFDYIDFDEDRDPVTAKSWMG
jgi:gluconokinase